MWCGSTWASWSSRSLVWPFSEVGADVFASLWEFRDVVWNSFSQGGRKSDALMNL